MFALILISFLVVSLKNYEELDPKSDKKHKIENGIETSIEIPNDNTENPNGNTEIPNGNNEVPNDNSKIPNETPNENIESQNEMFEPLDDKQAAYELCKSCIKKIDSPKSNKRGI